MHSAFIAEPFFGVQPKASKRVELVNALLEKLRFGCRLTSPTFTGLMTNVEQRMNMFHLASQVLAYNVPGDLVELGCHEGKSSVLLQKIIDHYDPKRTLHLYDSFEGLPSLHELDDGTTFKPGWFKASKQVVIENLQKAGLTLPRIHVGWFKATLPTELPEQICFAYLDGDLYESILLSLEYVYPRLSECAICLIDDYNDPSVLPGWNQLPGVKRACDEFLADKPEQMSVLYAGNRSHGYFRKK